MKTLTLSARVARPDDPPGYHDFYALQAALRAIARGKPAVDIGIWSTISTRLQEAELDLPKPLRDNRAQEITIEIKNTWAKLLWEELKKLPPETFGGIHPFTGQREVPDLWLVTDMLVDFAEQLGEVCDWLEEDEEE